MILKIVQVAVFSAPCFGVCAQFVRGAVREMRKRPAARCLRGRKEEDLRIRAGGGDGNTVAVNQSLLPEEKAGVRVGRTVRRFTVCRHSL